MGILAMREVLPLAKQEILLISEYKSANLCIPVHFHPEYEICLILNGKGLKRTIGDRFEITDDTELIFTGPNVPHGWEQHNCRSEVHIITIQLGNKFFEHLHTQGDSTNSISQLLNDSECGISIANEIAAKLSSRLLKLLEHDTAKWTDKIISLLKQMADSPYRQLLPHPVKNRPSSISILDKIIADNITSKITADNFYSSLNMSPATFARFLKDQTGRTFVSYLNETRISFAVRWLIETDHAVSEIAAMAGFNNLSHFNRIFKNSKGMTPGKYREKFFGSMHVL